ncbi:TPA: hypothetical protein ACT5CR_004648 [Burkholderia cenocepacia]
MRNGQAALVAVGLLAIGPKIVCTGEWAQVSTSLVETDFGVSSLRDNGMRKLPRCSMSITTLVARAVVAGQGLSDPGPNSLRSAERIGPPGKLRFCRDSGMTELVSASALTHIRHMIDSAWRLDQGTRSCVLGDAASLSGWRHRISFSGCAGPVSTLDHHCILGRRFAVKS